jgi:hypothetical protein
MPITSHSSTPGWLDTTASTSFGKTLNPDTVIMSFLRSTIRGPAGLVHDADIAGAEEAS